MGPSGPMSVLEACTVPGRPALEPPTAPRFVGPARVGGGAPTVLVALAVAALAVVAIVVPLAWLAAHRAVPAATHPTRSPPAAAVSGQRTARPARTRVRGSHPRSARTAAPPARAAHTRQATGWAVARAEHGRPPLVPAAGGSCAAAPGTAAGRRCARRLQRVEDRVLLAASG